MQQHCCYALITREGQKGKLDAVGFATLTGLQCPTIVAGPRVDSPGCARAHCSMMSDDRQLFAAIDDVSKVNTTSVHVDAQISPQLPGYLGHADQKSALLNELRRHRLTPHAWGKDEGT